MAKKSEPKPGTGAMDSPLSPEVPHNVSETATSDPTGSLATDMVQNMPDGAMSTAAPGEAPEPMLQSEGEHDVPTETDQNK